MAKRTYTQVQVLLPEIREMIAAGKTQREIAEHYGFSSKTVVKQLLNRERKKIPQQLILHLQSINLILLLRYDVTR